MPRAVVLNSAGKNNVTGGTFADTLTAFSGDSLSIPNLQTGKGRIIHMWGNDSDSVCEYAVTDTRVDSIHDPTYGIRFNTQVLGFGGAGNISALPMLEPPNWIDVFTGDTLTFTISSTASDDVMVSWLTEYQDLPGASALFASWASVQANRFTEIGVRCAPVANGTAASAYGTARAANADETRWTGGRWYAILGFTVQIPCTTVSFKGPMWANFRFGCSAGVPFLTTSNFFLNLDLLFPGDPMIPVFNGYDAGNVLLEAADTENSTSPKVDIIAVECINNPAGA